MAEKLIFFDTIVVDENSRRPLYAQVYSTIRHAILGGKLRPGTKLPSTRALAHELGVGRNTVITAFEQLKAEGFVETATGSGTHVAVLRDIAPAQKRGSVIALSKKPGAVRHLSRRGNRISAVARQLPTYENPTFAPGLPAIERFPQHQWARILGRCARHAAARDFDYSHMAGIPELRRAIVEHLGAARGVQADPRQVIVLSSAQAALDLAARLTLDVGDVAWIEDPGYLGARGAFVAAGAKLLPISVDAEGLDVEAAISRKSAPPKLIYVTPSHQCPTGVTLSLVRRLGLIEFARQTGAWIIEDDYDSEFRYRGNPISSLQGLDREGCVMYMGTFSKTMLPGIRVGYLVVPESLIHAFEVAVCHTGQAVSKVLQRALAEFLEEGHFAEHTRQMRRLYAERQFILISEINRQLSRWLTVQSSDTGIQLVTYFDSTVDDREVSALARELDIVAVPLSRFFLGKVPQPGLFLGYAATSEERIVWGIAELARAIERSGAPSLSSQRY